VCKTNPILRLRLGDWGFRTAFRRDAPCGVPGQGPVVQTNPIGRSESCKTNPIPGGAGWDGARGAWDVGANAQNEANFGRSFKGKVSSVKSGKPGKPGVESSYFKLYTWVPKRRIPRLGGPFKLSAERRPPRAIVQNEPNFPAGPEGTGPGDAGWEVYRAKQTQFSDAAGREAAGQPVCLVPDDLEDRFRSANRSSSHTLPPAWGYASCSSWFWLW